MHPIETLLEQVKIEATNIKVNATPEEIAELCIQTISAYNNYKCIYGQMTGDCYNARANELIILCAERVYPTPERKLKIEIIKNINGKPEKGLFDRASLYHSPIEMFLSVIERMSYVNKDYVDRLINYIKGKGDFTFTALEIEDLIKSYDYVVEPR